MSALPEDGSTMSDKKESCDLCGLVVEEHGRYCLELADESLTFCCDACLGIYKLLNEIDEDEVQESVQD